MAWPPTLPPTGRANSTPQVDAHPSDHNLIAAALAEIVARLGPGANTQLGYVEQTAAQTGITTTTVDLTGMSITFTLATQRRVRLEGSAWYTKGAPDTSASVFLQIANAANVQQQGGGAHCIAPGFTRVTITRTLTLAPGTYTYKCRGSTAAGFVNTSSSTVEPSLLQAIDLGPA